MFCQPFAHTATTFGKSAEQLKLGVARQLLHLRRELPWIFVSSTLSFASSLALIGCEKPPLELALFTACALALAAGVFSVRLTAVNRRLKETHQARYYALLLRNEELKQTRLQLVKQDEFERRMLAGDLHDQVLNDLKNLKQQLCGIAQIERETMLAMDALVQHSITQVKEVMDSLSPSSLEHIGILAAAEECLRRSATAAGFQPRFRASVNQRHLPYLSAVEQSLLYRLIQEALTNVRKHAHADKVRLTFEEDGDLLIVKICDDGHGITNSGHPLESRGIRFMKQRASLLGATIRWLENEEQRGTTVEIRISRLRK